MLRWTCDGPAMRAIPRWGPSPGLRVVGPQPQLARPGRHPGRPGLGSWTAGDCVTNDHVGSVWTWYPIRSRCGRGRSLDSNSRRVPSCAGRPSVIPGNLTRGACSQSSLIPSLISPWMFRVPADVRTARSDFFSSF